MVSFTLLAALPSGKKPSVPIGEEAGWAPEPVWTTWRRKILDPTGIRTPTPVVQPVSSRYTLSIFEKNGNVKFIYYVNY
jgi:hypothetical protein